MQGTNKQVAQAFAAKSASEGKSSNKNLFFHDGVVYSYGYHFPIARWNNDKVLFTTQSYSVTTARHKGPVLRALLEAGVAVERVGNVLAK